MIKGFDHKTPVDAANDTRKMRQPARELVIRVYDRFYTCGSDSPKQIPVGLVLSDHVEILVGMFPRDVLLLDVLEIARIKRDSR